MSLKPLSTADYKPLEASLEAGPAPMLQWIDVGLLVVDDAYQRPVRGAGRKNVRAIAESFDWSKFSPVIVSPVEGGRYAVIDGQHRSIAAMLRGISQVPAQVVIADRAAQARAFAAINGLVTAMTAINLHHARVAAAEDGALGIDRVCAAAGVRILRYPLPTTAQKPGDTLAAATVGEIIGRHGEEPVVAALRCLVQTGGGHAGLLLRPVMMALSAVLAEAPSWRGERLHQAFERVSLRDALARARAGRARGVSTATLLATIFRAAIAEAISANPAGETFEPSDEAAKVSEAPPVTPPPSKPASPPEPTPARLRARPSSANRPFAGAADAFLARRSHVLARPADVTADLMGDPEPGRSALDQRRGR